MSLAGTIRFAAVGLGIAELAAEALRAGATSTLLDDPSQAGISLALSRPGTLRFAAYDGPVACGVVSLLPNGSGQAEATVIRFDGREVFSPALQAFLGKTMEFTGLEIVRSFATEPLDWLPLAGFSHDGRLRQVWRPSSADHATPMQNLEVYTITLSEARPTVTPAGRQEAPTNGISHGTEPVEVQSDDDSTSPADHLS